MAYIHPSNNNWPTIFISNKMLKIFKIVLILKFSGFVSTNSTTTHQNERNVKNHSIINEDDVDADTGFWNLNFNESSSQDIFDDVNDELLNFLEVAYQNFSYLNNENLTIDRNAKNSFEGVFLDEKVIKKENEIFNSHELNIINSGNRTLKRIKPYNENTKAGASKEQNSNILTIKQQFNIITSGNTTTDSYLIKDDDDGKIVFSSSKKNNKLNENLLKNNQKISKPHSVQPVFMFQTTNKPTSSVKDKLVSLKKVKRAKTTEVVKHAILNNDSIVDTDNNNLTNHRKIIYDSLPMNKNTYNLITDIKTTETTLIDFEFYRNDSTNLDYDDNFSTITNLTEEEHFNITALITNNLIVVKNISDSPIWPVKHNAIVEGDVILGGLMMVHSREDRITCGPIMPQGGIQALEAMLFTLDIINRGNILPNISLGAHILDDCDKDTYGLEMAVDFIKGKQFLIYVQYILFKPLSLSVEDIFIKCFHSKRCG